MLYLGHFSFDEIGQDNENRNGYFSCKLEAQDADSATILASEYILSLKETEHIFDGIVAVYIEDIVEIHKKPGVPVIVRLQSSEGRFPKSISRPLPVFDYPNIILYGLATDVNNIEKRDTAAYQEATPLIEFPAVVSD